MTSLPGINVLISQCLWILIIIQSGINKPFWLSSYSCLFVFQGHDISLISDFYFLTRVSSFSHELGFKLSISVGQETAFLPYFWTPESLGSSFPVITSRWDSPHFAWCSEHPGKRIFKRSLMRYPTNTKCWIPFNSNS